MKELHWLKVPDRFTYKITLLMYRCVKGLAPEYLIDIVLTPHRSRLRSATELKLPVIRSRNTLVHGCSFASMGPRVWNALPGNLKEAASIEQIKSLMKTHLLKLCYIKLHLSFIYNGTNLYTFTIIFNYFITNIYVKCPWKGLACIYWMLYK